MSQTERNVIIIAFIMFHNKNRKIMKNKKQLFKSTKKKVLQDMDSLWLSESILEKFILFVSLKFFIYKVPSTLLIVREAQVIEK